MCLIANLRPTIRLILHVHVQCSRLELSILVSDDLITSFCFVFLKARAFQTCVLGVLNTSIMHVYPVIAQTVMKSGIFSSLSLYIYEYTLLYVIVLLSYEPMVLSVLLTYYLYVLSQIYLSNECVYLFFKSIIYLRTVFS